MDRPIDRITRRSFVRGTLASGLWLAGCGVGRPETPPHVVVVLVDQLRKDAADRWLVQTGELASRAITFDSMRSVSPWTYPSVISFLSGLLPQQHGADGDMHSNRLSTFDRSLPLLPGRLRSRGWHTAGFVANPFLHTWNPFHESFDHYDIQFVGSQGNRRGYAGAVWDPAKMFADRVNEAVTEHFGKRPVAGPEFTYVHYIDVHGPWKGAPFDGSYPAAVRWMDERIVELYRFFSARYDEDVLFFVTSDHGRAREDDVTQGYGKPWRKSKGSVHDFNLRIPFLVLPGRSVGAARRIAGACSNVDFAPTLLDWLGLPPAECAGRSLWPAIADSSIASVGSDASEPVYARVSAFGRQSDCAVIDGRKFLRHFDPDSGEEIARRVFDLAADPRETRSLAGSFEAEFAALEARSGPGAIRYPARFGELEPEVESRLRALGYLQ